MFENIFIKPHVSNSGRASYGTRVTQGIAALSGYPNDDTCPGRVKQPCKIFVVIPTKITGKLKREKKIYIFLINMGWIPFEIDTPSYFGPIPTLC